VAFLTLAAFLAILALLASQLRPKPNSSAHATIVLRRVYETRVLETLVGARRGGNSVAQSVSSNTTGSSLSPAPVTRSS
jgi:hypothetical protein